MTRVAKKKPSYYEVDLSVPLKEENFPVKGEDCFSKEWDGYAKECQLCSDATVCSILTGKAVYKQAKELEVAKEEAGVGYLDNAEMLRNVDQDLEKLKKLIVKFEEKGEPMSVEELITLFGSRYKISDEVAVKEWIKRFIHENQEFCLRERKFRLKANVGL